MTDTVIRSRIDPLIKLEAAELFRRLGLTLSDAIRIFLYQTVAEQRIPFSIKIPNAVTRSALNDATHHRHLQKTSLAQLQEEWDDMCEK